MEPQIIPAIISENFEHLKAELNRVKDFVPLVQIDITDGLLRQQRHKFNEGDIYFEK